MLTESVGWRSGSQSHLSPPQCLSGGLSLSFSVAVPLPPSPSLPVALSVCPLWPRGHSKRVFGQGSFLQPGGEELLTGSARQGDDLYRWFSFSTLHCSWILMEKGKKKTTYIKQLFSPFLLSCCFVLLACVYFRELFQTSCHMKRQHQ